MVETNIFDRLLNSMVYIYNIAHDNAYLLMCGDYNSRTCNYPDFVVDDTTRHVQVLPDEYMVDFDVPPRASQDTVRPDSNGLLLLDLCRQTGMRILNGRVGNDAKVGKYTYIGSNGSSLIDYMLVSQELFNFVQSFHVQDPNILSDHCCLSLTLQFPSHSLPEESNDSFEAVNGKYLWNAGLLIDYKNKLNSNSILDQLQGLNDKILSNTDQDGITTYLSNFNEILSDACTPFFKTCKITSDFQYDENKENPWFNDDCEEKRYIFLQKLNIFRSNRDTESQTSMASARSEYKKTIRKARYEYDKQKTLKFEQNKFVNAKSYWKMLKESANIKTTNVNLSTFERYFKAINNPTDPFFYT